MAGLIQEIEDPLPHFPPAPPPSPEAQPRACNIFTIPTSAFNPLDMRQNDFADLDLILSQTQNSSRNPFLETVHERENPFTDEDDFGFPASPKKRICNSPSSFPEGYSSGDVRQSSSAGKFTTSTSLPYSKTTRQHHSPVQFHSPPLLNVPTSNTSPSSSNQSFHQTSPYSIPSQKPENGFEIAGSFQLAGSSRHLSPPPSQQRGALSKSFDLHNVHPFETASELPDVRPRRAYTLDANSKEREEASRHRRRKISVKRTKEDRDSDLQFSFEYSYTSTGSSEESDWLVVSSSDKMGTPYLGKIAYPNIPSTTSPPLSLNFSNSYRDPSSIVSNLPTDEATIFYPPTPTQFEQQQPTSMDSVQMMDIGETSLKLDSIDSMDCGPGDQANCLLTDMDIQTGLSHPHPTHTTLAPPTQLRSHSSEDRYASVNRHSFVPNISQFTEQDSVSFSSISRSL